MNVQEFLRDNFHLENEEVIRLFTKEAKIESVKRGRKLLESGEIPTYFMVLIKGICRGYLLHEDGFDMTDCFAFSCGDVIMGCNRVGKPSLINIEMASDGEILMIPLATVLAEMDRSPELWRIQNQLLQEALMRQWNCKVMLLRCSAMERYQCFLKYYPGLINVVNNKHIASFQGMTPVTMSRLRRQLRQAERENDETDLGKT